MATGRDQGSGKGKEIMKILVLGIGNPILSDDAVGILVVQQLSEIEADVEEASIGGIALLDFIRGYDKVIIADAVKSRKKRKGGKEGKEGKEEYGETAGRVSILKEEDIERALHASSTHDVSFSEAIALGRTLFPEDMPSEIIVVGIEVQDTETFSETPTKPVQEAIPKAVALIRTLVKNLRSRP